MGGRLVEGLGAALLARQVQLDGRELSGEFRRLDFQNQIDLVSEDLMARHWTEESLVIANSFGAYLFLHAQLQLPKYVGRVVLLSSIVGEFCDSEIMMYFSPPRADKLFVLAREGRFVVPDRLEIYVGQDDWQSNPASVSKLFRHTGATVAKSVCRSIARQIDCVNGICVCFGSRISQLVCILCGMPMWLCFNSLI